MKPKNIVLIENDDDFRFVVKVMLEDLGYHVAPFAQFTNIDEVDALQPDIFEIDEQLPVINGHTLCMILKSKQPTKDKPVILISGSERLEMLASLGGADRFLAKPFTQERLAETLRSVA